MSKVVSTSSTRTKPTVILMDIEGTTTDRHFMSSTLSPFIKTHMKQFLEEAFEWPETKQVVKQLRLAQQSGRYKGMPTISIGSKQAVIASVVDNVKWQMKNKTMTSQVKQMQILCWWWGFQKNMITTHVYDDVSTALHKWKSEGIAVGVYSSAIVLAQKLLFVKTIRGNLYPLIDHFFDSSIGEKKNSESYKTIVNTIGCEARKVTFITDSTDEAKAAIGAGLTAVLIERPGKTIDSGNIKKVTSFAQIWSSLIELTL